MRETLLTGSVILRKKIIIKYLGERIKKEVVIVRIERFFFCVSLRYEMSFKLHLIFPTFHTSVKRRKITFNS